MSKTLVISATQRDRAGKGTARASRREGMVPAVIYGAGEDPVMVTLEERALKKQIHDTGFFTSLIDLEVGKDKHRVLARDVQLHPVTDRPIHVDFLRVSSKTRINVEVPVEFINEEECPGIKRGGTLNIVRHEVELSCLASNIPDKLVADLAGLDIGDSIHISVIKLDEGVTPTIADRDFTIATVAAPTVMAAEEETSEAEEEAEEAEGEEASEE